MTPTCTSEVEKNSDHPTTVSLVSTSLTPLPISLSIPTTVVYHLAVSSTVNLTFNLSRLSSARQVTKTNSWDMRGLLSLKLICAADTKMVLELIAISIIPPQHHQNMIVRFDRWFYTYGINWDSNLGTWVQSKDSCESGRHVLVCIWPTSTNQSYHDSK